MRLLHKHVLVIVGAVDPEVEWPGSRGALSDLRLPGWILFGAGECAGSGRLVRTGQCRVSGR